MRRLKLVSRSSCKSLRYASPSTVPIIALEKGVWTRQTGVSFPQEAGGLYKLMADLDHWIDRSFGVSLFLLNGPRPE
jgi:hypothetical protein